MIDGGRLASGRRGQGLLHLRYDAREPSPRRSSCALRARAWPANRPAAGCRSGDPSGASSEKLHRGRDPQGPVVLVVREHGHQLVGPVLGGAPALDVAVADPTATMSPLPAMTLPRARATTLTKLVSCRGFCLTIVLPCLCALVLRPTTSASRPGLPGNGQPPGFTVADGSPAIDRENPLVTRMVGLRGGRLPNLLPFLEDFA